MTSDERKRLATRLAATQYEDLWSTRTTNEKELAVNKFVHLISVVHRAGLAIVEAEDGR